MPRKQNTSSDNFNAALPSRLRTLLKENGVTQQEIADYIGKKRQVISRYADGSSSPDWQTIVQFAEFFNVSTDYLLGLTNYTGHDTGMRAACDYTGLSETSLRLLRGESEEGSNSISADILNFLIENERTINLLGNVELYLKFNPLGKYCAFDDKGNMAECAEENISDKVEEMKQSRLADSAGAPVFVQAIRTEKIINRLVLSDIESGLSRARGEYQKEHLLFVGEKEEG